MRAEKYVYKKKARVGKKVTTIIITPFFYYLLKFVLKKILFFSSTAERMCVFMGCEAVEVVKWQIFTIEDMKNVFLQR